MPIFLNDMKSFMADLESCRPAFPRVGFAMVHAGLHSEKKKTAPFEEPGIRKWAEGRRGQEQDWLRGTRKGGSGNGRVWMCFLQIMNCEE